MLDIGVALAGLEAVNLYLYLTKKKAQGTADDDEGLKALASGLSLGAITLDTIYAHVKSEREIVLGTNAAYKGAGDIVRGGFKLAAGVLSVGASGIGMWLELKGLIKELSEEQRVGTVLLCAAKFSVAGAGLFVQGAAALSYAGPMLQRLVLLTPEVSKLRAVLTRVTLLATELAERVALLRWVARVNLVGFGLLLVEGGCWLCMQTQPGELELWCRRSMFAKAATKDGRGFGSADQELKELALAIQDPRN